MEYNLWLAPNFLHGLKIFSNGLLKVFYFKEIFLTYPHKVFYFTFICKKLYIQSKIFLNNIYKLEEELNPPEPRNLKFLHMEKYHLYSSLFTLYCFFFLYNTLLFLIMCQVGCDGTDILGINYFDSRQVPPFNKYFATIISLFCAWVIFYIFNKT